MIYDIHEQEQEQDDELEKCRQHAADNIPVIISTSSFSHTDGLLFNWLLSDLEELRKI